MTIKEKELEKIINFVKDKMNILNNCKDRFEYENLQRNQWKKKEELDEDERMQLAMI